MGDRGIRVVHLAGYGGPYPGSFVPMLRAARAAVEAQGWSFEAVLPTGAERHPWFDSIQAEGLRARVSPHGGIATASARVIRLVHEQPARTLLHTHFSIWDLPAVAAGRMTSAKVLWHLHSPLGDSWTARVRNTVRFGAVGRSAQRILCVGPEIRDKAVARLAPRNRTEVFVNGIDTSRFGARRPGEREAARAALDIAPGQTVLLLFAWDWHRKGGTLLLETVLELRRRGSEVLALVVTTDSEAELQVRRLGLETSVRVIAPRDDARQLYIAADLFISPSTAEGMPFAVLEALASGTPVIASNIPSHRFVADQLSACCVVERDPRSFASAIEAELARDHEARRACLHRGRREIEAKYSLSHWSERLVELYSELLEEVR